MSERKFKAFDKVLYRLIGTQGPTEWIPGIFSRYHQCGCSLIGGQMLSAGQGEVIPYEGNENLIGKKTRVQPYQEVMLDPGEYIICFEHDPQKVGSMFGSIRRFKTIDVTQKMFVTEHANWSRCIRLKDFKPDMDPADFWKITLKVNHRGVICYLQSDPNVV